MTEEITYPALYLKRGEDARLRAGHLWVFSNEVDVKRSPLTAFQPGDPCVIADTHAKPHDRVTVNSGHPLDTADGAALCKPADHLRLFVPR